MIDDLVKRLRAEIYAVMGPSGADYSEEPVVFYEEAAAALIAKDAEIERLRKTLGEISLMETGFANATVRRMARHANNAL